MHSIQKVNCQIILKRQSVFEKQTINEKLMKGIEMEHIKIRQNEEFIKLGQALKAVGAVESGVEAKK